MPRQKHLQTAWKLPILQKFAVDILKQICWPKNDWNREKWKELHLIRVCLLNQAGRLCEIGRDYDWEGNILKPKEGNIFKIRKGNILKTKDENLYKTKPSLLCCEIPDSWGTNLKRGWERSSKPKEINKLKTKFHCGVILNVLQSLL